MVKICCHQRLCNFAKSCWRNRFPKRELNLADTPQVRRGITLKKRLTDVKRLIVEIAAEFKSCKALECLLLESFREQAIVCAHYA